VTPTGTAFSRSRHPYRELGRAGLQDHPARGFAWGPDGINVSQDPSFGPLPRSARHRRRLCLCVGSLSRQRIRRVDDPAPISDGTLRVPGPAELRGRRRGGTRARLSGSVASLNGDVLLMYVRDIDTYTAPGIFACNGSRRRAFPCGRPTRRSTTARPFPMGMRQRSNRTVRAAPSVDGTALPLTCSAPMFKRVGAR